MMLWNKRSDDIWLFGYRCITWGMSLFATQHLKKRVARGKEDPIRWPEKQGHATCSRPQGRLVWLHAVGLGEVLALRGVIDGIGEARPDVSILVTSSTRASAEAFTKNTQANVIHQFLPLDISRYATQFLDHWQPDLVIWSEQDIWPNFIDHIAKRSIPQVLINARMNTASFQSKTKARPLFRRSYRAFDLVSSQTTETMEHIQRLSGRDDIRKDGSLKPSAPPLTVDQQALEHLEAMLGGRRVHLVAPSHANTEEVALEAFHKVLAASPSDLLIIAPRDVSRANSICDMAFGLNVGVRSRGDEPAPTVNVYVADTIGEMGLWYCLASTALIGGSFSDIEGHNPWEAVQQNCGVIHGPRVQNFEEDYAMLDACGGAIRVETAVALAQAWQTENWDATTDAAQDLRRKQAAKVDVLIKDLLVLLDEKDAA